MYFCDECYIKPKLTQISKWRGIFRLQITTVCWKWLFMPSSVSSHVHTNLHSHLHHHFTDKHMNLTRAYKPSCDSLSSTTIQHVYKHKKKERKKLDVIWIYSTLLIYSFTLWSHCGDLPQWNFFFWHINYCNVTINILFSFTWQIWYERKLYSIFTHIYARDVIKERTTHIAMHSASNIHRYICL